MANFRIAIRRRWNYENNVSAIVCYMSTGKFLLIDCLSLIHIFKLFYMNICNIFFLYFEYKLTEIYIFQIIRILKNEIEQNRILITIINLNRLLILINFN